MFVLLMMSGKSLAGGRSSACPLGAGRGEREQLGLG